MKQSNGTLVRLGDIADVVLGAEDYNTEVRFSQQNAVFMGVWVLPNANAIDVIKRVRTEMDQIQKELPTGMTGMIAYDSLLGYRGTNSVFYPGLSNTEAIARTRGEGHSELGPDDERPLRQTIDEIAWLLGTQFSVQVPGQNGAPATVLITATSTMPSPSVAMEYLVPVQGRELKGHWNAVSGSQAPVVTE